MEYVTKDMVHLATTLHHGHDIRLLGEVISGDCLSRLALACVDRIPDY